MTKGPRRLVLDQYLDTATEGVVKGAGQDWKNKADDLQELADALKKAAAQAELRIGEQTLTGPAIRASMEESSASMTTKAEQLRTAGEALRQVGQQIADTRDTRDSLADLGAKPSPYQAPAATPGVEPTPEEIQAQAAASQARSDERGAWQTQYDKQEARSLALTREMDAAFLGAIPPMKDIHGQQDPTEPPPDVPSGPGGTYLPGTQAPPPTGGGNGSGDETRAELVRVDEGKPIDEGKDDGKDDNDDKDDDRPKPPISVISHPPTVIETTITNPPPVHPEGPTSTVTGSSQNGVTYQPTGSQVAAPSAVGGSSAGASAAALGAAGGAGGLAAGAIRPGSVTGAGASSGAAPVRAIGSTGRAGSAGALSRSAGGSAAGRGAGSAGSPASRSAGSAASRSAGSAAGRGASTGSSAGRGSAGGRSAGGRSSGAGAGAGSGSRSGGRGASGARSGAAGTGGSRGGRRGEGEQTTDRDSLVYDQDWLGDDDVAPGVLD